MAVRLALPKTLPVPGYPDLTARVDGPDLLRVQYGRKTIEGDSPAELARGIKEYEAEREAKRAAEQATTELSVARAEGPAGDPQTVPVKSPRSTKIEYPPTCFVSSSGDGKLELAQVEVRGRHKSTGAYLVTWPNGRKSTVPERRQMLIGTLDESQREAFMTAYRAANERLPFDPPLMHAAWETLDAELSIGTDDQGRYVVEVPAEPGHDGRTLVGDTVNEVRHLVHAELVSRAYPWAVACRDYGRLFPTPSDPTGTSAYVFRTEGEAREYMTARRRQSDARNALGELLRDWSYPSDEKLRRQQHLPLSD
jgi:hypothetical protein